MTLQILRSQYDVFAMGSEEIKRCTGIEAMMEYDLETTVDPDDLADLYCFGALRRPVEWIGKPADRTMQSDRNRLFGVSLRPV